MMMSSRQRKVIDGLMAKQTEIDGKPYLMVSDVSAAIADLIRLPDNEALIDKIRELVESDNSKMRKLFHDFNEMEYADIDRDLGVLYTENDVFGILEKYGYKDDEVY